MSDYRDQSDLTARDVCPTCKRETTVYLTSDAGNIVETHRCRYHGDVVPMRSAVVNGNGGSGGDDGD